MKKHKYRVAPKPERTLEGVTYQSKAEMQRAAQLKYMVTSCGWIVTPQPRFTLGCPENVYVADFHIIDKGGEWFYNCDPAINLTEWVEDVKGFETAKFRHDVKLWKKYGVCPLIILSRRGSTWTRRVILPATFADAQRHLLSSHERHIF